MNENKKLNTENTTDKTAKNAKVEKLLTIDDIVKLYHAVKIGTYSSVNTSTKYRIMRGGSSLNIKKSGYTIYTTNIDFENLKTANATTPFDSDVELLENANASDKKRCNVVTCKTKKSLTALLKVYAMNALNIMQ